MPLTLVIETATAACSVALLEDDGRIAERHEVVGRGHAERLVPMIAELIGDRRPDAILVDCGPGSFTGVRVGLAAARGLALGWGVAAHGFSSLALIAVRAAGPVTVAIPGGHGELFVQRFTGPPLRARGPMVSLVPAAAAAHADGDAVIGPAAPTIAALRGEIAPAPAWPRAADVALLPAAFVTLPPSPLYGRAPDAKMPG